MPTQTYIKTLEDLHFDNRFLRALPNDSESDNYRRQVYEACYSRVQPRRFSQPQLVAFSPDMADELDLSPEICLSSEFTQTFVGNALLSGMEPYACCYGGHQFGQWAGQLGDGRAINLGEAVNSKGETLTLQLKGSGLTPYSRSADGLAVLRSSVREFLCSEAMFHLGVPTTRALSVILTGEFVRRDMFYDGNPQMEPGAVVCRVAPSFTRFGSFQIFTARDDLNTLKSLIDFTIKTDYPHLPAPSVPVYLQWYEEVCKKTAEMILHWQRVGFVHGVMNTDNMSILGLTIDYGPYGWLENYDPDWTPNTTDAQGKRYRYGNQIKIAYWNLVQLANAIYPLIKRAEPLQQALNRGYTDNFSSGWQLMMADKFGLSKFNPDSDEALVADCLSLLQSAETDMTLFFRGLADFDISHKADAFCQFLLACSYTDLNDTNRLLAELWFNRYQNRLKQNENSNEARIKRMNEVNPLYVLRNYLAQQAIDQAESGDFSLVQELLNVLRQPYTVQAGKERFAEKRPEWARHRPGCSMLSCSS